MKRIKYFIVIALIFAGLCRIEKTVAQQALKPFVYPEIPAILTEPEQRAEFLVENYWLHFNFADANYINSEVAEQAWVDFINILPHVQFPIAQKALKHTFKQAEKEKRVYLYFTELADKYLYDPNSPYRDEEYYISVLEQMISSPVLSKDEKIRPNSRLKLALKNRVGTKAHNITYTLESGRQGTLYEVKSEYTILFFNNPGCHACEEMTNALKFSLPVLKGVMNKQIAILAMYSDEELDEWRRHLKDFPKEWINGYDKQLEILNKNIYDLKAIPTLYLLDKNKTVLLKDATIDAIESFLKKNLP